MNIYKFLVIVFTILFAVSNPLKGQNIDPNLAIGDTTQIHVLETKNGDVFIGRTVAIENLNISFLFNRKDTLNFKFAELSSLNVYDPTAKEQKNNEVADTQEDEDLLSELPEEEIKIAGTEKVFFMPSSFSLKKNQWEYRNIGILFNSLEYGLNDHVTIGADLYPMIISNLVGVKIKGTLDINERFHVSAGARLHYVSTEFEDGVGLASYFAGASIGTRERFINFSYGLLSTTEIATESPQYFSIGGSLRISEKWKLMGDSFFSNFEDTDDFPSFIFLGASHFGHKHRLDFGLSAIVLVSEDFWFPIPTAAYGFTF